MTTEQKENGAGAIKLLMRRPALAVALSISERTISTYQAQRKLPYIKSGKIVLFDAVQCVEALARIGRVPAIGEPLTPQARRRMGRNSLEVQA